MSAYKFQEFITICLKSPTLPEESDDTTETDDVFLPLCVLNGSL